MKIDFVSLTDHELADIISAAADEWKLRQPQDHKTLVKRIPAPKPKVVSIAEPPEEQKSFVLHVKALAMSGGLVRASERRGVAAIADHYPAWVERQGLPTEGSVSAWTEFQDRARICEAPER